jgi:dihydrofolate reductase
VDGDGEARLRVTLLGALAVCRGDTAVPVAGARLRGLLVRLALAGGRAVDPDVLVDALWPGERPADPANALQSLVSRLRRMLGATDAVAQVEGGYRLDVHADEWGLTPHGQTFRSDGPAGQLMAEMSAAGPILSGRRTAEQVGHWGGDHHGRGVRIFVPSHRPPDPSVRDYPLVTYVADGITSAMAQAKAAAGDRHVHVIGAYTAQRAIEAGVLDEVQIHQIPVLFGAGRRLFDVLPARVELDIIRVIDTPEATHIRYRIRR